MSIRFQAWGVWHRSHNDF